MNNDNIKKSNNKEDNKTKCFDLDNELKIELPLDRRGIL